MISRRTLLGAGVATLGLAALPTVAVGSTDWDELACRLRGTLVLPSDRGYATAKQLELAQFDSVGPSAIAYCVSAGDVSSAVRFARHHGVPVAVRSGGHSFGGYSTTTGLVIDVSRLNEVTVGGSTVTIGPGAQNAQILGALAPHGLVVSEGGCPTVAAGGFLQGGGYGFLTRPLGMACDAIVSAEIVLADGTIVTASRDEHPDLFWAIRGGGGGNFGIVTSFRVVPHDGDTMSSSTIVFPYSAAAGVLAGFSHWLADAPRSIGGGAFVQQADAGSVPNLVVLLASPGTPVALSAQIDRLLAITGAPLVRQDAVSGFRDLMMNIFGCGALTTAQCARSGKSPMGELTRPAFGLERSRLGSTPIGPGDWPALLAAFDAEPLTGQSRFLDLQMFGGAANDVSRTATAYVHRDALFSVNYRVLIDDPRQVSATTTEVARSWVDRGFATVDPLSSGESFQNWIDPALTGWRRSYYAENYPRLRRVKTAYDPEWFFRFAQGVEPAPDSHRGSVRPSFSSTM